MHRYFTRIELHLVFTFLLLKDGFVLFVLLQFLVFSCSFVALILYVFEVLVKLHLHMPLVRELVEL